MAPSTASLKPRRPAAGTKTVVPALPLPYIKRQPAPTALAARSPPLQRHSHTVLGPVLDETPVVSGAKQANRSNGTPQSTRVDPDANGYASSPSERSNMHSVEIGQAPPSAGPGASSQTSSHLQADASMRQSHAVGSVEMSAISNGVPVTDEPRLKSAQGKYPARASEHRPPPAVSPTSYQMPPNFQPAARGPQHGPPGLHQTHPSNGSIHFGTFHDSQSSSPAPPHSGGIAPPPGIAGPDGRPGYMGHNGNGFPPMIPYGGDMMQLASFDNYGRPTVTYGPMESYPPYGASYAPSTPHSFHDSQSPVHPEENGIYGPYPPGSARNGGADASDDVRLPNPQRRLLGPPEYPRMPPNMGPPPMMPLGDHGDGVIGYLQQHFASPELADCTLELRYPEDQAPPVRIPGHRLIFSRSPALLGQLRRKASEPKSAGEAPLTLVLESDGPWIRSDAFYMAVQRLYGLPLLHMPPHGRADHGDMMEAGSAVEQFEFALAYAAAGRLLDWPPVTRRGCEVATQLLGWQTMEKGLEFALDNHSDKGTHDSYKYGDGSRIILHAVAAYIVHNMAPNFSLDPSTEEARKYARLPVKPLSASTSPGSGSRATSPATARGSVVQLGKGRRPHQITNIQFGDLSLSEAQIAVEDGTPKATNQAQPASHPMLSRVLLNLPFTYIKMMADMSASANVNGWASAEARHRVLKRTIEEREARRLGILQAVVDGRVTVPDAARTALRSPSPQDMGRWTLLGWQEEMLPCSSPGGASVIRKWVPLMERQNGAGAAYP